MNGITDMEIPLKKILCILACGSVALSHATHAFAEPTNNMAGIIHFLDSNKQNPYHAIVTLSGGIAGTSIDMGETFQNDLRTYDYDLNSNTTAGLWGGFIGAEKRFITTAMQLGLSYYQASSFHVSGDLGQGVDPLDIYSYQANYNIITRQLLIEGKLLLLQQGRYHPYFNGGLGTAFNTSTDYDVNYDPELTTTALFKSDTKTAFSYMVGAGVDIDINQTLRLGIGYRYANFGNTTLGDGSINGIPIEQTLVVDDLDASEVLLQLTFII